MSFLRLIALGLALAGTAACDQTRPYGTSGCGSQTDTWEEPAVCTCLPDAEWCMDRGEAFDGVVGVTYTDCCTVADGPLAVTVTEMMVFPYTRRTTKNHALSVNEPGGPKGPVQSIRALDEGVDQALANENLGRDRMVQLVERHAPELLAEPYLPDLEVQWTGADGERVTGGTSFGTYEPAPAELRLPAGYALDLDVRQVGGGGHVAGRLLLTAHELNRLRGLGPTLLPGHDLDHSWLVHAVVDVQ